MIERFEGLDNRRRLIEALKGQVIVRDDQALANALADVLQLQEYMPNASLITQDEMDQDLYLIIAGKVSIQVNGREVAIRATGEHVGEMALIDPTSPRSASVIALEPTVAAKISEPSLSEIAERFPRLWRLIALQLCNRLRQRNDLITHPNPRPVVFVASSVESLPIAREIQDGLQHDDILVRVWTDKIFGASSYPMESLEKQLITSDFAVIVVGPDDQVYSRGRESDAPRDNVIIELGLFMGALTRQRTFIVRPRGVDIKLPSDILGLSVLEFAPGADADLASRMGPVCNALRTIFKQNGPK